MSIDSTIDRRIGALIFATDLLLLLVAIIQWMDLVRMDIIGAVDGTAAAEAAVAPPKELLEAPPLVVVLAHPLPLLPLLLLLLVTYQATAAVNTTTGHIEICNNAHQINSI